MTFLNVLDSFINEVETPAFIMDENVIIKVMNTVKKIKSHAPISVLYTLKSLTNRDLMQKMVDQDIDGFAVSSLFEAKLARQIAKNTGTIHFTSPGLRKNHIEEIGELCDYITFNSLSQYQYVKDVLPSKCELGLRINPQISFVQDARYNPCDENSKLGIPLSEVIIQSKDWEGISGIHFHTNCESRTFVPLLKTIRHLCHQLPSIMKTLKWINMGGGYLFDHIEDFDPLYEAIDILHSQYGLKVFMEPGSGFIDHAACLVSSAIDAFAYGKSSYIVLDTTVNHLPEVYEYQYQPKLFRQQNHGQHAISLVGCSCLTGDVFGRYFFDNPLQIGSRVAFLECGAYSHVKSHMFNGINLPTLYVWTSEGKLKLKKMFSYQDFLARCGDS